MQLESSRRYRFHAPPERVWHAFAATDEYRRWWPWLAEFEADGLVAGDTWRCEVRPPLRYRVRFEVHLEEVEAPRLVTARVSGGLVGRARVDVAPDGDDSEVRVTSILRPASPAVALLGRVAAPVARRGHAWVLDTGARQFGRVIER